MWNSDLKLIVAITVIWLVSLFLYLLILACTVRNTQFIAAHPWRFLLEVLAVGLISSLPTFYVAKNRGSSYTRAALDVGLLSMKIGIIWLLMELAGVTQYLYPARS